MDTGLIQGQTLPMRRQPIAAIRRRRRVIGGCRPRMGLGLLSVVVMLLRFIIKGRCAGQFGQRIQQLIQQGLRGDAGYKKKKDEKTDEDKTKEGSWWFAGPSSSYPSYSSSSLLCGIVHTDTKLFSVQTRRPLLPSKDSDWFLVLSSPTKAREVLFLLPEYHSMLRFVDC